MRRIEGRQLDAMGMDARDVRIIVHLDTEALGIEDLRHQEAVGHGRRGTVAEGAGGGVARQVRLEAGQALAADKGFLTS